MKLPNFTPVVLLILSLNFAFSQNNPLSDPTNLEGWILNQDLSDDFDGTELDKDKWWILGENDDFRNKWKGRAPGQFAPHNVKVENGELVLSSQWEPDYTFLNEQQSGVYYGGTSTAADNSKPITQACVLSERFFKYGYMEVRCKIADAPVTSAFWTTGYHSEIDMVENYGKRPIGNPEGTNENLEKTFRTNMISWDPDQASDHKNWKVSTLMDDRLASDYFVYGFEWDKDYVKIYFEGELIRTALRSELEADDQWRHMYAQEIWLDSEVFSWYGLPNEADLVTPAEFKIDYVRIWQKEIDGPNFDALGFEGPFYYSGRSSFWWAPSSTPWRVKNDKSYDGDLSLKFDSSGPFSGNYTAFSPYGSIDLPSGSNTLNFKVWIDPTSDVDRLDFVLSNPYKSIQVDISNVNKGEWVDVSQSFSRNSASDTNITNGDRLQVMLRSAQIQSSSVLLYVDDISFENDNNLSFNEINKIQDISVSLNKENTILTINSNVVGNVKIFNIAGVLVSNQSNNQSNNIDISNLDKGVYIVLLKSKNFLGRAKIIIQ